MSDSSLNIVVLGYIVRGPLGGLVWHHLQYVLGLKLMGHNVLFVEDSDDYDSCFNPLTCTTTQDPSYGLEFTRQTFNSAGIGDCWAYHDAHKNQWHGPQASAAVKFCRSADLLLNLSAVNPLRSWFDNIPTRALIDTDPVFTQIKHVKDAEVLDRAEQHTHFLSFGENIGKTMCTVPSDGLPWQPTRQPVVISCWANNTQPAGDSFTTIMQWDSYPSAELNGIQYGLKSASFDPYVDLPNRTGSKLELALGSANAPRQRLKQNGWILKDPLEVTKTASSYQHYIQQSKAEFAISKHGYVNTHSGWFSERSANYLASGRPVIVQSTGFTQWLETGNGVLTFKSPDEAIEAIETVELTYEAQSDAARDIAFKYFDHKTILKQLLESLASTQLFAGVGT